MKKLLLIPFIYLLFMTSAHAYLDPGTGSIIVSAIVAGIATIKYYWNLIKNFFKNKIFKNNKEKQ